MFNLLLLVLIGFYVPTSTLVWLGFIPAIIASIYYRKLALSAIALGIFMVVVIIYALGAFFPAQILEFLQNVAIILFLYTKLFPYHVQVNLLAIVDLSVLIWTVLFILAVLVGATIVRYNELHVMLSFSYFMLLFSLFYLVLNIVMFLIPAIQVVLETVLFTKWIITVFYVLLPLITLTFTLLFIESFVGSAATRTAFKKSSRDLKKKKSGRLSAAAKYVAIFVVVLVVAILILGVVFS